MFSLGWGSFYLRLDKWIIAQLHYRKYVCCIGLYRLLKFVANQPVYEPLATVPFKVIGWNSRCRNFKIWSEKEESNSHIYGHNKKIWKTLNGNPTVFHCKMIYTGRNHKWYWHGTFCTIKRRCEQRVLHVCCKSTLVKLPFRYAMDIMVAWKHPRSFLSLAVFNIQATCV